MCIMNTIYIPLGLDYCINGSHEVAGLLYTHIHMQTDTTTTTVTKRVCFCIRHQAYFTVMGLNGTIYLFKELCVCFSQKLHSADQSKFEAEQNRKKYVALNYLIQANKIVTSRLKQKMLNKFIEFEIKMNLKGLQIFSGRRGRFYEPQILLWLSFRFKPEKLFYFLLHSPFSY